MTNTTFDKEKTQPDVIDNREFRMADILDRNLSVIDFLDVSSGYFEVSGYGIIHQKLEQATSNPQFKFRLMVGKDAIRLPIQDTFEEYRIRAERPAPTLEGNLQEESLNHTSKDDVSGLIKLLQQDNVHVRRSGARFNHAKCYILGNMGAIVGSSNFTRAGLSGNDELNAGVYGTEAWKKVRLWYERMWDKAADAKEEVIHVLEQSKFGAPATPHEIYLKMLFEKYKRILTAMEQSDTTKAKILAKFQQDAVYSILQIIDERGGAILADSTGLGKTHIGIDVMHKKISEGKKILLVAPAQIRDTVWQEKLEDSQISAKRIGTEELGRSTFDITRFKKYDFIVIDESQNFRSGTAGRWRNLMKMITLGGKKQVLLMSATPINNSLMDLYYQTSIITGGREDMFIDIGIPNLYDYMKKAANHRLNDGLEKIQLLLDTIMVRRTRTFIREVYPNEKIGNRTITFPKRDYQPIRYNMTDIFGNIYRDLLDTIKSLHMVPYGIERYNHTLTDEEKRKHEVLAHLQVILLLKRFESSVNAIITSLENKITLFEHFGSILDKDKIVSPKQLHKIMLRWNTHEMEGDGEYDEQDQFFMNEINNLTLQDTANYDTKTMREHIQSDLNLLEKYRDSLKDMPNFDKKAEAVAETVLKDGALHKEGRKVLVFTEYTDTATYVKEFLENKFKDRQVGIITGKVKKSTRADIIRRFSPVANLGEDDTKPDEEIDILVSTEVLSEGQNLQDCNYVINYDLPWNPMRIVQRIGRVDRLTSIHDTVHSRECFPDEKLDDLLRLVGRLMGKIEDINESIGLDADLLGQEASPKSFEGTSVGRIRALAGGNAEEITDEMERESDLMPDKSPINEISQYIKKVGITKMEGFSMGRRSGKAGDDNEVILSYIRESPKRRFYCVMYDYDTKRAEMVEDAEAIRLARCRENEPVYLPMDGSDNSMSFAHLLDADSVAREKIAEQSQKDYKLVRDMRSRPKKNQKTIQNVRDAIYEEAANGNITEEEAEAIDSILDSPNLLQWSDDLETFLHEYHKKEDIEPLMKYLKKMRDVMDIEADTGDDETATEPGNLILVGALFISK